MRVLGAILAGGRSSRFGSDKALALIDERPMLDHVSERLAVQCDGLVVIGRDWPGLRSVNLIKTGDQAYCIIGEWDDMDSLAAARPHMIETLDTFRDCLDGDTDPVSGPVVLELK